MAKIKKEYDEIDHIKEDLNSLRNNVVELTKHLQQNGSARADDIRKKASERLTEISTMGRRRLKDAEKQIKAKPAQSVAVAFVAGALLSALMRR